MSKIISLFVELYKEKSQNNEDIEVNIDTKKEDNNIISKYKINLSFPCSTKFELNDLCQIRLCYQHRMTDMNIECDLVRKKLIISYGFLSENSHIIVKNTTLFVSQCCQVDTIFIENDEDQGTRKRKKINK